MPKVSIIIPCYNIESHLSKCIETVLSQSETDFELLLINDGSQDATLEVIETYAQKDTRIRVFTHDNQGVSFTRNQGIQEAKADWILFIDGDDYIKPDYVEKHLEAAEEDLWPISGMLNVKNEVAEENNYFKQLLALFPNLELKMTDVLKVLEFYSLSSPWARIYSKKKLLQHQIEFDSTVSYQEDLLFNLEYIKHIQGIRLIDYFGYYYEEHGDTSSTKFHKSFNHIEQLFELLKEYANTSNNEKILQEFIFQSSMKKIANTMHSDSGWNKKEQCNQLKSLFESNYFQFCKGFIPNSKINFILKFFLRKECTNMVYYYFKRLHN